jgi:monooxygenase
VRSDSDMYTLGYRFQPWVGDEALASGPSIRNYVRDTAQRYSVDRHVHYGHRVVRAGWSSADSRWTVEAVTGPDESIARWTCRFLYLCSGYYDYAAGHSPTWPGLDRYRGTLVHPQQWPEGLDYAGKRVVVIGSGATAVTLVPAMADKASHVTMLQRSPSYVLSLPNVDVVGRALRRVLPASAAHALTRWKNVGIAMGLYALCRHTPRLARRLLKQGVVRVLGERYDVDTHFNPAYEPWDQRLCFVPDDDLLLAIKSGRASIVTDRIAEFTERGITLESGVRLAADVIVTATGLKLLPLGGIALANDGASVDLGRRLTYRGAMLDGVPNLAFCIGYTNASWTLRADLVSRFVCRLLAYMSAHAYVSCTPRNRNAETTLRPLLNLSSGYVQRSVGALPMQGVQSPWTIHQNHAREWLSLRFGRLGDGALVFERAAPSSAQSAGGIAIATPASASH